MRTKTKTTRTEGATRVRSLGVLLALACGACQSDPATAPGRDAKPDPDPPAQPAADPRSTEAASAAPEVAADGTIYAEAELMGTRVSMRVWLDDPARAAAAGEAVREAFAEISRIESIASEWQADSELSQLNAAAGGPPRPISRELLAILERARAVSEDTEGRFDVTFHAVGQLWSFKRGARPPSDEAIAAKLPLVNFRKVELEPERKTVRLAEPGMRVGLGAIAKGYAVDEASKLLERRGFSHHIVEGGGDTYARGSKGGQDWQIGVQHPGRGGAIGALKLHDKAVVTSGNYMRYFEWEGRRYTHILDPQTGWPISAESHPKSVTCVADNATDADAYCTALTIMGKDAAMTFVSERPGLDVIVIDHDDTIAVSAGIADIWRKFE